MLAPIITDNLNNIKTLCLRHEVKELFVFGSAALNEFNEESDVDLIVKFKTEVPVEAYADLYFDLADELEELFKRKVDLMTDRPIKNKYLKLTIEGSKQMIYAA
jgi:predicted nucleotidyltransferase